MKRFRYEELAFLFKRKLKLSCLLTTVLIKRYKMNKIMIMR